MKKYEAPKLFVDSLAADTMIASTGGPKNGNANVNQNCAGCKGAAGQVVGENVCVYLPGTPTYDAWC